MKIKYIAAIFFVFFLFLKCTSVKHIDGRYSNVYAEIAGEDFKFGESPNNIFEYQSRVEGMIKEFSLGTWVQAKDRVFLNGFNDKNINILDVENRINEYPNENKDKIVVKYVGNPLDTFVKVEILVNGFLKIRISGDTTFYTGDIALKDIQVKSYLSHEGVLLGTPPRIDTLFSRKFLVDNMNGKHKVALLKFDVPLKSFYRVRFEDSLVIKNKKVLLWNNKQFKKVQE